MTREFEQKLTAESDKLEVANAPSGLKTCPNCKLCTPAADHFQNVQYEYARCLAKITLPTFCHTGEPYRHVINLSLFDPASTFANRLNRMECPLFEPREIAPAAGAV